MNLREDSFFTGLIIGLLLPVGLFFLGQEILELMDKEMTESLGEKLQLFLFAVNAIMMRQFMIKREQDKIGRGILVMTMILVFSHVIYYYTSLINP
ncbi:MAG: hypothetical protein CL843_08965 [Crocinitomicaceae bacterium]|nr:hypothetical protein [Crocinitomicaceae bacterium]|tara:strand:- start:9450 stop:9737 length:288 start_codon:yes stop_codon:yes gene_type:complete